MADVTGLAIVGAGALGQSFAALLAVSGQAVTLLATSTSAARLAQAGRIQLTGVLEAEAPVGTGAPQPGVVTVTDVPGRLPAGVGLIFATKGHHLPAAIATVRAAWPAATDASAWVAGIQNGLVKDDALAAAFGRERVVGGVTIFAGQREPDGRVTVTSKGATYLGEFPRGSSPRVEQAVAWLDRAGVPTQAASDIQSVLWSKACNAVGVFGVSVLTRGAPVFGRAALIRAYLSLIRETAATAAAYGVAMGDYVNFPIKTYLETPEEALIARFTAPAAAPPPPPSGRPPSLPSMTQDLLAGRPIEVEAIFGDIVERARRAGVPAPRMTLIRDLLYGIDPGQGHV